MVWGALLGVDTFFFLSVRYFIQSTDALMLCVAARGAAARIYADSANNFAPPPLPLVLGLPWHVRPDPRRREGRAGPESAPVLAGRDLAGMPPPPRVLLCAAPLVPVTDRHTRCNHSQRYLRLSPAYFFYFCFYVWLMPFLEVGPMSRHHGGADRGLPDKMDSDSQSFCTSNWWTNALYIQNLYPFQFDYRSLVT